MARSTRTRSKSSSEPKAETANTDDTAEYRQWLLAPQDQGQPRVPTAAACLRAGATLWRALDWHEVIDAERVNRAALPSALLPPLG